ncbi:Golgi transport complex subunit 6 [Dipsacomyces acuminosporus]|nr:Golgi transport complex subunit 6 [Dipsacomyces acuminosporus]
MALSTSSSQSPPLLGDSKRAGGSLGRRVQQIVSLPLDSTEEIVKIRSEVLAKSFINALVIGNEKNGTKPIELHAADPLRYVGDMLAWIHQTCAEEKELLNTLFFGSANSSASDVGLFTMDHWETKSIKELLGLTFENIARPLEIRILQTIEELNNSIVVYRIYNLLAFYNQLFAMVCPIDTLFMATMEDLHKTTYEKFQSILNLLVDNCIADFDSSVSHTLDVPDSLNALLNVVSEILFIHEDSIAFSDNRNDDSKNMDVVVEDIYKILDKILDEAHLSIQQQDKNLRDYEQTIFEHNVLHFITTQLGSPSSSSTTTTSSSSSPSSPSQSWYAKCAEREALLKDNLASQLLAILKDKSHLDFEELKGGDVADNDLVVKMIEQFNQALKGDLDISRLLIRMGSYLEARDVAQNVKGMFIEKYSGVYNTVSERLKDAADILHTPETVSTLL